MLNPEDRCVEDEKENNYETLKPSFFERRLFYFNFIQLKSPTSIGGEMNADLSYFSAGVHTSAEIEELSLRTPRPVAMTE
ncbi:hypothetical protein [Lysinibacillus xylanilyticus]|uniref:hypothetical protein n=1 Tax=Lysinibacillus xylanilyticus TaxID=582475 RepID=UPI0038098C32